MGVGARDENPFGIWDFQPSFLPGVRNSTCLSVHLFVSLLGYYFHHSFVFLVSSTYYIFGV